MELSARSFERRGRWGGRGGPRIKGERISKMGQKVEDRDKNNSFIKLDLTESNNRINGSNVFVYAWSRVGSFEHCSPAETSMCPFISYSYSGKQNWKFIASFLRKTISSNNKWQINRVKSSHKSPLLRSLNQHPIRKDNQFGQSAARKSPLPPQGGGKQGKKRDERNSKKKGARRSYY